MNLTTPAQTSCSGTSITWNGSAWTGNSFSGDTFRFIADGSSVNTSVGARAATSDSSMAGNRPTRSKAGRSPASRATRLGLPSRWPSSRVRPPLPGSADRSRWRSPMTPPGPARSRVEPPARLRARRRSARSPSIRLVIYRLVATGGGLTSDPSSSFTISETALGLRRGFEHPRGCRRGRSVLSLVRQEGACDQDIPVTVVIGEHQFDIIQAVRLGVSVQDDDRLGRGDAAEPGAGYQGRLPRWLRPASHAVLLGRRRRR